MHCISQTIYLLVLWSADSGPSGTLGPLVQPHVPGGPRYESDVATIRNHKMAARSASGSPQKVDRAPNGLVQVQYIVTLGATRKRCGDPTMWSINVLLQFTKI